MVHTVHDLAVSTCLDLVHEPVAELLGVVVADLGVALQRQQSLQDRVARERRRPSVARQRRPRAPLHTDQGCQMAKFDPFLSLDCARVEGVGAQSKERKGSNFAA